MRFLLHVPTCRKGLGGDLARGGSFEDCLIYLVRFNVGLARVLLIFFLWLCVAPFVCTRFRRFVFI